MCQKHALLFQFSGPLWVLAKWSQQAKSEKERNVHIPFFFYSFAFWTVLSSNVDVLLKIRDSSC